LGLGTAASLVAYVAGPTLSDTMVSVACGLFGLAALAP